MIIVRSGKLGVVVLILAITCTLGVSWVMSMDVNEVEVTKYKELTDINSEFQTEKTPEYIVYNPSTNYTGYYTDDSIIGNQKYFDGVEFEESKPNNYRVNQKPIESDSGTYDLTTISEYNSDYRYVVYADYQNGQFFLKRNDNQHQDYDGLTISLSSLITQINTGHNYNYIRLASTDNNTEAVTYGANESVDWCVFSIKSEWHSYNNLYNFIDFASAAAIKNPTPAYNGLLTPVKLSAEIYLDTQQVLLYYDNDFTEQAGIYALNDVLISCAGGVPGAAIPAGYLAFGTNINYTGLRLPDPVYLDPSKGVNL